TTSSGTRAFAPWYAALEVPPWRSRVAATLPTRSRVVKYARGLGRVPRLRPTASRSLHGRAPRRRTDLLPAVAGAGARCYISARMRIGGLDVGDRRIGIAISDEKGWTAQGLDVLTRTALAADLAALAARFAPYAPTTIVV